MPHVSTSTESSNGSTYMSCAMSGCIFVRDCQLQSRPLVFKIPVTDITPALLSGPVHRAALIHPESETRLQCACPGPIQRCGRKHGGLPGRSHPNAAIERFSQECFEASYDSGRELEQYGMDARRESEQSGSNTATGDVTCQVRIAHADSGLPASAR